MDVLNTSLFLFTSSFSHLLLIYIHTFCRSKLLGGDAMSLLIVSVMPSVREPLFFKCFFIKIDNFMPYNDNNLCLQERWKVVSEENVGSVILIGFWLKYFFRLKKIIKYKLYVRFSSLNSASDYVDISCVCALCCFRHGYSQDRINKN